MNGVRWDDSSKMSAMNSVRELFQFEMLMRISLPDH